jgi:hypothetical protein
MPSLPVKLLAFDQTGAPSLDGTAGSLIAVLDAALVNGFNLRTVTSFVITGGVGVFSYASAPGHTVDQVIKSSGASDGQYNTEWRVTAINGATVSVDATGFGNATVAGSLSTKTAPLGWTKVFSGTNKAVYKSPAVGASGCYLRVDDTYGQYAKVRGYEAMTDVDTGTGMFPTTVLRTEYSWGKSNTATTAARQWHIVGDDRLFYLSVHLEYESLSNYPSSRVTVVFGDIVSYKAGDAFGCILTGVNYAGTTMATYHIDGQGNSLHRGDDAGGEGARGILARSQTQIGSAVECAYRAISSYSGYNTGLTYPNAGDNALLLDKTKLVVENATSSVRGELPGFYTCLQVRPLPHGTLVTDAVPGRTLMMVGSTYSYGGECSTRFALDVTGPWR